MGSPALVSCTHRYSLLSISVLVHTFMATDKLELLSSRHQDKEKTGAITRKKNTSQRDKSYPHSVSVKHARV